VEDNWGTGRIGNHSFDEKAGTLADLFTFGDHGGHRSTGTLLLDPTTGQPQRR